MLDTGQAELSEMPEPAALRRYSAGGQTVVSHGRRVVFRYGDEDTAMRNLAVVALTDAGVAGVEVAAEFGLSAEHVSRLRARARRDGAAGLVARRGRPPKLSDREVGKARRWAGEGVTQTEIAVRLNVARSVVSGLLARLGPLALAQTLTPAEPDESGPGPGPESESDQPGPAPDEPGPDEPGPDESGSGPEPDESGADQPGAGGVGVEGLGGAAPATGGLARIDGGVYPCRYAGAGLLHAYLDRVGAAGIFATLTGAPSRHFDDVAVLATATVGFALGIDTVEGAKHLRRTEAGAVLGLATIPELRTLRTRLGALADGSDPLALQRAFAKETLAADPPGSSVYYVDDHFVAYAGARPLAKGYNTRRRLAEPGRADTVVCDARGRAVLFASGEPSGLTRTMPGVLAGLREVLGPDAGILLGFDRGGSYPTAFTACRQAGMDWVTYRRGKLAAMTAPVARCCTVRDGRQVDVDLADETVEIAGYGPARQLTLVEDGTPVLQVLTSDTTASGAALLAWLRARWRIENLFKYADAHHGISALADYTTDIAADTAKVTNPARTQARAQVAAAEAALATAERALPQLLAGPGTPQEKNAALPQAHQAIDAAAADLAAAKTTLAAIPAKLPANELDPTATRARPRLQRRGLQMVLRLLAFNAEAWLAEHFNAYLADPDEYRAILRNLLHLGGEITYRPATVTITLDQPDSPRIAQALRMLTDELNTTPAHIPGDPRPLSYQVAQTRSN